MVKATLDPSGMLLRVSYAGRIDADETRQCVRDLEKLQADLKPGFQLLTDLSQLEAMTLDCVPDLKRMMDLCDERKVKMVVRVIPEPHKDIGLNILSLFHYRRGVRIITCQTFEQAEQILAQGSGV